MNESTKKILVYIEATGISKGINVEMDATAADIINALMEDNPTIEQTLKNDVGNDLQLVIMRKGCGNSILTPATKFSELDPSLQENEAFKLAPIPVVAGLPQKIFNVRIENLIEHFYLECLPKIYGHNLWELSFPIRKGNGWLHPHFDISIKTLRDDNTYGEIEYTLKNVPSIIDVIQDKPQIGYKHTFLLEIPRNYPSSFAIKIINLTPLYHPRVLETGFPICYAANGELDTVFVNLINLLLMKPEAVRPPSLYENVDWGLSIEKMNWYIQYPPRELYKELFELWDKTQVRTMRF